MYPTYQVGSAISTDRLGIDPLEKTKKETGS